jgi:ribose 5-phosphate isomerase B
VFGGSGQGEQIAANKVHGVRAALCVNEFTARLAREHNDANVLALGGRVLGTELAVAIVDAFLEATFDGGRHERRVRQIDDIEREECE